MSLTLEQFGINNLNSQQRLELIRLIWDSLSEDSSYTPPEWHVRELERRLAVADTTPEAAEPWETVFARLSSKSTASKCWR